MKQEKRPSYVRRNRIKTSQEKARAENDLTDDADLPRRSDGVFSSTAFPVYTPDMLQRRLQTARQRLTSTKVAKKASLNEVLAQLDSAGYADVMAFAEQCSTHSVEFEETFSRYLTSQTDMADSSFLKPVIAHLMVN